MSIAVSAVLNRSRWLSGLIAGMCAGVLFIAYLIGSGKIGNLDIIARAAIALICCTVTFFVFFRTMLCRKIHAIHVSGTGQIRLSVLPNSDSSRLDTDGQGELVELLPISTLWSGLLILHLRHASRRTSVIVVSRDSLPANSYRALLVACRWISLRHADDHAKIGN